jgi:hypothetical protein
MTFARKSVFALASGALLASLAPSLRAQDVFLVASYHETDACGQPQYLAAIDALQQGGFEDLSFKGYFLDTRVQPKDAVASSSRDIIADIQSAKPRFVFTIDDAAFSALYPEVLRHPDMVLVFTGLNRSLEFYNAQHRFLDGRTPVANLTGVFEYLFMREQFEMIEAILGRPLRKVAILHSTDAIGGILKDQILDELRGTEFADRIVVFSAADVPSMIDAAKAIDTDPSIDAYVPVTMSMHDPSDNQRKTMAFLAPILTQHVHKIDLSLNSSFTQYGFFGGVSVDFYQMGFQAGFMATKILKGIPIRDVPVEDARRSIVAINRTRMRQLGIQMPPDVLSIVDEWIE